MKMIISIIAQSDELETVSKLNEEGYFVTNLATIGGFLRKGNTTMLIVTEDEKVEHAKELIRKYAGKRTEKKPIIPQFSENACQTNAMQFVDIPTQVGGCTMFVVDVEDFEKD